MTDDVLLRAQRTFARRRFGDTIRLLEPQVYRFRESFDFYYLLGHACVRSGDIAGGYSYLRRAEQLRPGDVGVLRLVAAIYHRRGERERAIETYLEVLEAAPDDAGAQRGLTQLRRDFREAGSGQSPPEQADLDRLLPPLPWRVPRWLWLAAGAMLASLAVLMAIRVFPTGSEQPQPRSGLAAVTLPGPAPEFVRVDTSSSRYALTDAEVVAAFERSKALLGDFRENAARVEMNRILVSNATEAVKARVRTLDAFFTVPDFSTLRDPFTLEEILVDPRLHSGTYVAWSGLVANVAVREETIEFDLLVGYQQRQILEGHVRVTLRFAALVENGAAFEVLGIVRFENGAVSLEGISLHELAPTSNAPR
jgi:hypothetical protein